MKIINARVLTENDGFIFKNVYTCNNLFSDYSADDIVVDAKNNYIVPGLVDIHFHGCLGFDFSDCNIIGLEKIAEYELANGVTSIVPTTVSMPFNSTINFCELISAWPEKTNCSRILGLHLEGPFLNPQKKGAHNQKCLCEPDVEFMEQALAASDNKIVMISMSPELNGAISFINKFSKKIVISIAHTTADYLTAISAIEAGANHLTHLYNSMPPLLHREPGVIGAMCEFECCFAEIVCDGIHIHPSAVKAALKLFGEKRLVFISDSMMAAGMENGNYSLGGLNVSVDNCRATLPDGTIAGSVLNLYECVINSIENFKLTPEIAFNCASINAAKSIGMENLIGSIEVGKYADFLILDEEFKIKSIYKNGDLVI